MIQVSTLMKGKKGSFLSDNKRGIGYAIAEALHKQGADIVTSYAVN